MPCALAALALSLPASAQLRTGHAIPGFHGLEVGVAPASGFSYENATVLYTSSKQTDRNGNELGAGSLTSFSNHSTFTYATPWLLFGANVVVRARIPIANSEPNPHTTDLSSNSLGLGDIYLQPLSLYWEGAHHRVTFGYAYWMDTGKFTPGARDNIGKGFATHEGSLGLTYYPSKTRDWHMSVLARYEINGGLDGSDLKPGQGLMVDWSVGKHLNERWNVGAVGYGVWQVTRESGADGNTDAGYYGTAAIGGEARYSMPDWNGDLVMRGYYEFNSFNRPEGQMLFVGLNFGF